MIHCNIIYDKMSLLEILIGVLLMIFLILLACQMSQRRKRVRISDFKSIILQPQSMMLKPHPEPLGIPFGGDPLDDENYDFKTDPHPVASAIHRSKGVTIPDHVKGQLDKAQSMNEVSNALCSFYNGKGNEFFEINKSPGRGIGIFAKKDVPAHTIVGVYPGYDQKNMNFNGKAVPKYILMHYNSADLKNNIFPEFAQCFAHLINEPSMTETPNTTWIQEPRSDIENDRMSIVTTRDIKKGEECLINYGPYYQRDYLFSKASYHAIPDHTNIGHFNITYQSPEGTNTPIDTIAYDTSTKTYRKK